MADDDTHIMVISQLIEDACKDKEKLIDDAYKEKTKMTLEDAVALIESNKEIQRARDWWNNLSFENRE